MITTQDLPFHLQDARSEEMGEFPHESKGLPEALEEVEKDLILKALQQHQGIQTKAAGSLRISERVLRYKMKKYKIRSS
jgi:transcriptional regulator with PAS, ATPase and Fis domain